MLLAWSSVSPCNHYTEAVNLPMLTPGISGVRTASLAGTICFRVSQNCTELAQNWKRPWKELYRGYKPAESTVPRWMVSQHFAAICTCPPSHWGHCTGHYLCAAKQGKAAQNWLSQRVHSWPRAKEIWQGQGGCGQQQPHCTATLSSQHRIGVLDGCKDLCQQLKSQFQKWTRSFERDSQEGADCGPDSEVGSGCSKPTQCLPESPQVQLHPGDEITVLRLRHQAGGMKVADSTELTLDDPRVSASLMVLCTFLSIHELQPELSETLVSGAQQGRCKINRIWSAARDLTRLQRLWYFTEA